jgi:hypothetical protein
MNLSPTKQPSGFVPIAMSLAALAAVGAHIALVGTAPQPDEGTAAHIWQLMMAGQIPVIAFYAIKWLPRTPRAAMQTIAMQIVAALGAMAPVYWLGW